MRAPSTGEHSTGEHSTGDQGRWAGDRGRGVPLTARALDGTAAAAAIKSDLAERIAAVRAADRPLGLATLLIGEDRPSQVYVAAKHRDCAEIGLPSRRVDLPEDASQRDVLTAIAELNGDTACTGYIVQLPLPAGIDENATLEAIDPAKDADGLHPRNLGRLVLRVNAPLDFPVPCTPRGCVELLSRNGVRLAGADVCVIGRGTTVGRSIGLLLTRKEHNATVTLCHTGTRDLAEHVRAAEIVIAAAGYPGLITAAMVRPGAAVLDVGVSRVVDSSGKPRLCGDVDPGVADVAGWLSPNPGGVGPMTRAMLLANVVEAAERVAHR